MKKSIIVLILFIGCMLLFPSVNAEPELRVELPPVGTTFLMIRVENTGDTIAHNITLTDLEIDGFVFYNNRIKETNMDVEPGASITFNPDTAFFGLGFFTATMTITCDEHINATGTTRGFVFIDNIFVP